MWITKETLKRARACRQGIEFFNRHFPNGAEMIDVINYPTTSSSFLHWGYLHLSPNETEVAAYYERLGVKNSRCVFMSEEVEGSSFINHSHHIKNSSTISNSNVIESSIAVGGSDYVEDSSRIFNSKYVYNSSKVYGSSNVNDSSNVVDGVYIVESKDVVNCKVASESSQIRDCNNVTDVIFSSGIEESSHMMFCIGQTGKEYMLFNKPVSQKQFELVKKQYKSFMTDELVLAKDWGSMDGCLTYPMIEKNIRKYYENISDKFWDWVKTLPNYDPFVLYTITFNPKLL